MHEPKDDPIFAGPFGQLNPVGGGDPIPLVKDRLVVGRRAEVDIQLKFPNVSSMHCRMTLENGYWFVRDMNSRNGTKVDGHPVLRKRMDPNSTLTVGKHDYKVEYEPQMLGAYGTPPADDDYTEEVMKSSLLDRAGMSQRSNKKK